MWLTMVGLLAAGIGMIISVPQVIRLARSQNADGVSLSSAVLGMLVSATWLSYGVALLDPTQLLANTPGLAGAAAVAVLVIRRTGAAPTPIVAATAGWAAVAGAAYLLGGPMALGMAATALATVRQTPQVIRVFAAGPITALSPASYLLGLVSATLWTTYGIGIGQPPVYICALSGVVVSALVLIRCLRAPATAPRPA